MRDPSLKIAILKIFHNYHKTHNQNIEREESSDPRMETRRRHRVEVSTQNLIPQTPWDRPHLCPTVLGPPTYTVYTPTDSLPRSERQRPRVWRTENWEVQDGRRTWRRGTPRPLSSGRFSLKVRTFRESRYEEGSLGSLRPRLLRSYNLPRLMSYDLIISTRWNFVVVQSQFLKPYSLQS